MIITCTKCTHTWQVMAIFPEEKPATWVCPRCKGRQASPRSEKPKSRGLAARLEEYQ